MGMSPKQVKIPKDCIKEGIEKCHVNNSMKHGGLKFIWVGACKL
jgi:hypothetical protein